jgi:cellulose biosynthesis protein BcsQ
MTGMHAQSRGDTPVGYTQAMVTVADISALGPIVAPISGRIRRKVLVFANAKGGVGKSSLAVNIAAGLARLGKKVLLVEMDPQGNHAEDLGFVRDTRMRDDGKGQVGSVIYGKGFAPTGQARPNLWVVPGGPALEDLIEELYVQRRAATGDDDSWLYMYAASIAMVEADYDIIILDVAPGSLVLQLQAMVAGDMVIIPSRSDESSRKGLRIVAERLLQARMLNPGLVLAGIVLFGVTSGGTRIADAIREELNRDIRGVAPIFGTTIRYVERAAVECRRRGLVAQELAHNEEIDLSTQKSATSLAKDYRSLAMEILTKMATLAAAGGAE